jgi:hypothetical protein
MLIFRHIFLSIYWWQRSDIWSQASYRYSKLLRKMWRNMCIYNFFLNVYKNQQSRQTGSRNPIGSKTLPTIWGTYMKIVTKYQISAINMWGYHKWALAHSSSCYTPAPRIWRGVYCFTSVRPSKIFFVRFLPSIVAEKNVTKNVHICSMCIKTTKSANRK